MPPRPDRKLPPSASIGGILHKAAVLQVVDRHADGSPRHVRVMKDDETAIVEGGEEFFVVFAIPQLTARRS
jgi:hypothetical protein